MTPRSRLRLYTVLVLWLATVAGCTGTQETTTPVAVVVAGNDAGSGDAVVGLVASGLPPDPTSDQPAMTWLPGFRRTVSGTVVDVAVARDDPVRLFVLHRDDRDRLTVFDASALDLADPSSFQAAPATIDLGALVGDADVAGLPDAPGGLCARGLTVSDDGRWAGVVHDAGACGDASDPPAVLLIELAPDAGAEPRVIPDVPSTNDAPGTPVIAPLGGEPALVWPTRDGVVRARPLSDPGGTPDVVATLDALSDVLSVGRGGQGLVVVNEDELTSVSPSDDVEAASWPAPSGSTLLRVVDAHLLPGTPALALATDGLVVVSDAEADVDADPDVQPVVTASVDSPSDAAVGPYGYAFVVAPATATAAASLTVFDLLTYLATPSTSIRPVRDGVESLADVGDPVAVDWLFVAVVP